MFLLPRRIKCLLPFYINQNGGKPFRILGNESGIGIIKKKLISAHIGHVRTVWFKTNKTIILQYCIFGTLPDVNQDVCEWTSILLFVIVLIPPRRHHVYDNNIKCKLFSLTFSRVILPNDIKYFHIFIYWCIDKLG